MGFPTGTIRLAAAQIIFAECDIQEIKLNGKTVGYRAAHNGLELQDFSLTGLCRLLWVASLSRSEKR
jgi:hypothetical protein